MQDPTPATPGGQPSSGPADETRPTWAPEPGVAGTEAEPAPAAPMAEAAATAPGDGGAATATLPDQARPSRNRALGVAAVGGAVVVAAAAVGFAVGAGRPVEDAADRGTAAAAERQVPRTRDVAWTAPDGQTRVRVGEADGRGMRGNPGWNEITITKIEGTKLSLETDNGWTRTIDAAGATVTRAGETVQLSTLQVGDEITFRETRNDDGTYTVTAIHVVQPTVAGTVASVSGSTVTVTTRGSETATVLLTGSTTYKVGDETATKDAVVVGARIVATGTVAADGTLTATSVQVSRSMASGTVKEKAASQITLTLRDDSTLVVKVDADTTYRVEGVDDATLANVEVGDVVVVRGTKNADGSLAATDVIARAAGSSGAPGLPGGGFPGGGFPGDGHGPGRGPWGGPDQEAAPSASPDGASG